MPVMERQQGNRTTVARLTDTASYAKHAGSSNSALSKEAPMSKFDPHPRVWLLHDMTNDEYIIETRRRQSGRLYVRKFGSHEQAEKFFRNLTTGERL